jgi:RecA/RadA recombinase
MSKVTEQVKKVMTAKPKAEVQKSTISDYASWEITLLNLACYGHTTCGIKKGHIVHLAGKASAAKTFVARYVLAGAANNPAFNGYELYYDDIEHGALMDTVKFYGQKLADRMLAPAYGKNQVPIYSKDFPSFLERINKRLKAGKKLIWVVDSLDALEATNQTKMGDGKAKQYSQGLRNLMDPLIATGSILILISQARANIGGGPFEPEDIIAGGRALEHYPSISVWLRKIGNLKKIIKGYEYNIGTRISARVKKNRLSGADHTVEFPFYRSVGIDDTQANVDYLVNKKHWQKKDEKEEDEVVEDEAKARNKRIYTATEFGVFGKIEELVQHIENAGKQKELVAIVSKVWREIETQLAVQRKPRYA